MRGEKMQTPQQKVNKTKNPTVALITTVQTILEPSIMLWKVHRVDFFTSV